MKRLKRVLIVGAIAGISVFAWGCGDEEDNEIEPPTKYIKQADEAVDQYNEGVKQLEQTGDSVEDANK